MATHEVLEDSHTMDGGQEVSPNTTRYGKGKVPSTREDKDRASNRSLCQG